MPQTPTLHVVCDNPECYWHDMIRMVRLQYLRQGVYVKPTGFVCECGRECRETEKPKVEPLQQALADHFEWALMEPPC